MSVFYIWSKYINQIREKKKPSHGIRGEELNFSTWQEAHSWLVSRREKEMQDAENALKAAKRSLQKARAMTRVAVQQSREGDTE